MANQIADNESELTRYTMRYEPAKFKLSKFVGVVKRRRKRSDKRELSGIKLKQTRLNKSTEGVSYVK